MLGPLTRAPQHRRRIRPLVLTLTAVALGACADQPTDVGAPAGAPAAPVAAAAPGAAPDGIVAGRVLARFAPGADVARLVAAQGAAVQRDLVLGIKVLSVPAGREAAVARALANNPNVEFAEPDLIRTFGNPTVIPVSDPYIGYKWDLDNDGNLYSSTGAVLGTTGAPDADIDWLEAWEQLGAVSGSARIGIMDSGVRADHEELVGRIAAQYDFFADDADAADDDGHGTHVAGITAAATNNGKGVSGVAFATGITFAIAKVCGPINPGPRGYGCPLSAIAQGITWAVDNGAHVLNLSLGGSSGSSTEQAALQYARSNGVLPFCAAGNAAGAVEYPGAFPECVAVSATDWSDGLASYSNFGPQVELSAPGGDDEHPDGYSYILSAYNTSATAYAFVAGTSQATPQAAGLAALLHALGVTGAEAKLTRMKGTADDLGAAGTDPQFGAGRINVHAAVNGLGGGTPTNSPPTAAFTYACTNLSCSFTDGSSDSDGSIASWSWSFGDGATSSARSPSHSYAAGGTYTVGLTVTDDDGATGTTSQSVTVSPAGTGGITLSASGYKVKGVQHADLSWSGASGASVDVFRNGARVATTANDGAHTDNIGNRGGGSYTYRVCEAGTSTCSANVVVTF